MELQVPSGTGDDAEHAEWRVDGSSRLDDGSSCSSTPCRTRPGRSAAAGAESQPGVVSRLGDLGHIEVRFSGLLGAVYAEGRGVVTGGLR